MLKFLEIKRFTFGMEMEIGNFWTKEDFIKIENGIWDQYMVFNGDISVQNIQIVMIIMMEKVLINFKMF